MSARDVAARAVAATYRRLGEPAVWFPLVGAKVDPVAVVPLYQPAGESFGRLGVIAEARSCRVQAASLAAPSPQKDDRVEIAGVRYRVREVPLPGDPRGLEWVCALERDC